MKIVVSKVIWSIVAVACIVGLLYIWLIGLPVPDYVATDDNAPGKVYTIQVAPNKFFDVMMSENEILKQSDYETTYMFENASVLKSSTKKTADLINADNQVYGRPGSFCYRIFNDLCTITVNSETSTYQGLQSLLTGKEYTVYGDLSSQTVTDKPLPELPELPTYTEVTERIYANRDYEYSFNEDTNSLLWYGQGKGAFYKATETFGLMGDITQQLLATTKACYKLDLEEYYVGDDYYMWVTPRWVLGVKRINRNTQLVVATNSLEQMDAAIYTLTR